MLALVRGWPATSILGIANSEVLSCLGLETDSVLRIDTVTPPNEIDRPHGR